MKIIYQEPLFPLTLYHRLTMTYYDI